MAARRFEPVRLSLADLVGAEYVRAAAGARSAITGEPAADLRRLGRRAVDFFPLRMQRALAGRLGQVGRRVCPPARGSPAGATSRSFARAQRLAQAPLAAWGYYRVGEDGRLYFTLKSEHYHAPVGHQFPGYRLLEVARALGAPNATHNNTRGWITRRLEEELVRSAGGLPQGDSAGLGRLLGSGRGGRLSRVLNLQTGSLACEAAIKMMLARFHLVEAQGPRPPYAGRVPVLLVVGDDGGGPGGNYHGTTIFAQMLRGMWPGLAAAMDKGGILRVAAIRPDDERGLEQAFARYSRPPMRIAGLLHELILMNYGGRRLSERFVRRMYQLCRRGDVPVLCDEIQTGLWSPRLYMFREYGVRPTFLAVGKGLPGGEYTASRLVFDPAMDCLPQFGALVTNGQEELASLAYLVTLRWAQANAEHTQALGQEYERRLRDLAGRFPEVLCRIDGRRHLSAVCFHDLATAVDFAGQLAQGGLDISVQTYKSSAPPAALTKLPLIAGREAMEMVVGRMGEVLQSIARRGGR